MPVTSLHLQGCTRNDRHAVVDVVEEAIRRSGGWILDFHQYSNISLVLELEVPPGQLQRLVGLLQEGGITFRPLPELSAEDVNDAVIGTLQITFVREEPDLRVPTPPLSSRAAEKPRSHGWH